MMSAAPDAGEFILGSLGTHLSELLSRIGQAESVAELAALAPEVRQIGFGLLDLDAGTELATRTVAQLNDVLTERVITVVARNHRLPPAPWCWLSLGSEGRCEQTFVTDQDNGLLFSAARDEETAELRRIYLPMAREVNHALAACGFPLCAGNIMAGNPDWCLSLDEWSEKFTAWVRLPEPQALLNSTIFFDFRPIYGDAQLATRLRGRLLDLTADNFVFLRMMSINAMAAEPPLGLFGDVVTDKTGHVDLKKFGARLFVDIARIVALGAGLSPVNTIERLRAASAAGALHARDTAASIQAFGHIQRLRLETQRRTLSAGTTADNALRTGDLNAFEARLLREALKEAKRAQTALKATYAAES
jgi:CBS domain-containing protein